LRKTLGILAVLAALAGAFLYGFVGRERRWFPYYPLRSAYRAIKPAPVPHRYVERSAPASRLEQREAVGALTNLPYLQGYNPALSRTGVLVYDETRAFPGFNLAASAHASQALLLDMQGRARHRWSIDSREVWPDLKVGRGTAHYAEYWRRAELLPGGDLLAIWEYIGVVRIDRSSRLKWASPNGAHHDLAVAADGTIYVLTREAKVVPAINPRDPVDLDFVAVLSPDGKELRRISLLSTFEDSDYAAILARMASEGDILHANSVGILDGRLAERSAAFRAGNLLISFRSLDLVAILDIETEKIVWVLLGPWRAQHSPRMLENGRMLVFDNFAGMRVGASRVLEIDPFTQAIAWRYGERSGQEIFSASNGQADRLANGNTLIVESNSGRAIEVTPDGERVWEYVNPFRAGEKKELQATLTQLTRLPADLDVAWADHP
jgi:Arylsulfotransferase (ASST)